MNELIIAHLENDYKNADNKNFVMLTHNPSQLLSVSSKQPSSVPVKTMPIKTNK